MGRGASNTAVKQQRKLVCGVCSSENAGMSSERHVRNVSAE
ncbi:hypothetical protein GCM10009650_27550 [Nesterenkonia jeotgali]